MEDATTISVSISNSLAHFNTKARSRRFCSISKFWGCQIQEMTITLFSKFVPNFFKSLQNIRQKIFVIEAWCIRDFKKIGVLIKLKYD